MPEETHHSFSPSKLKRFKLCPGSYKLSQGVKDESSPAAQEGTAMHMAVETGKILDDFNEEQKDCIQQCINYIPMISGKGAEILLEQKITIMDGFDVLTEGTADLVCVSDDLIVACDWKFGRGAVKVDDNNQVKAYTAGLMQKYKRPVEFHIGQPRLHYFESMRYDLSELPTLVSEIKSIRENCLSPCMTLIPSDEACKYCLANKANKCPAVNSMIDNTDLATIEHTGELSITQVFQYMDKVPLIESICKRLRFRAKEALIKGHEDSKWGLQSKRGATSVKDAQGAYNKVKDFVSMEAFMGCINVKYTALVDAYAKERKKRDGVTLKQSKEEMAEALAPFIERKSDSSSMVQKGD